MGSRATMPPYQCGQNIHVVGPAEPLSETIMLMSHKLVSTSLSLM